MNKHTPSPWVYEKCKCGHEECGSYILSNQNSVGFSIDDARLIAAAPELLEALKKARMDILSHKGATDVALVMEIDEAIAKAEGR